MKRRRLLKYVGISTIGLGLSVGSLPVIAQVKKGKQVKKYTHKTRNVEIETGGELEEQGIVNVRINSRGVQVTKKKTKGTFGESKTTYTTGLFPFGDEFNTPEALVEEVIESGQLAGA